jgi:hypothetical protein
MAVQKLHVSKKIGEWRRIPSLAEARGIVGFVLG